MSFLPDESGLSLTEKLIAMINQGDDLLASGDGELCFPRANVLGIRAALRLVEQEFNAVATSRHVGLSWKDLQPLGNALEFLRAAIVTDGPKESFNVIAKVYGDLNPESGAVDSVVELEYGERLVEYLVQNHLSTDPVPSPPISETKP